ncbi:uncharacterized protein LOC130909133 [Corythoichthys intestinalis]|uniref:uncharacterized protein LOC130909133 n=1 Tax=Corythoichthys intestinalis TaxID=161448 RepID=UPI0025A5E68B|nr:uncharacterized protein LOC130909133 [Corythoichthys intestinalis]
MAIHKKRSSYFSPLELQVLLEAYKERENIIRMKSNTAVAAKARKVAWQEIAAKVNGQCNQLTEKRTWQQLKMKYKNLVQAANRKKVEVLKRSGGASPPPPSQIESEEMVLSPVQGMTVAEAIPGGSSSESVTPGTYILTYELASKVANQDPPATATVIKDENVAFSATDSEPERPTEVQFQRVTGGEQVEGPSDSTVQLDTSAVTDLYRVHLLRKIAKTDKEMVFLDRQIRKADLEIQLLERQLSTSEVTSSLTGNVSAQPVSNPTKDVLLNKCLGSDSTPQANPSGLS